MTRTDWSVQITNDIISQIEAGAGDWVMPWHKMANGTRTAPINGVTGAEYNGINTLLLGLGGMAHATDEWASYKQWKGKGEQVAKGAKGHKIVFYKALEVDAREDQCADENGKTIIPMMKVYTVFNRDQLEGFTLNTEETTDRPNLVDHLQKVEEYVSATGADIVENMDAAYFMPHLDRIHMPHRERFFASPTCTATEAFYSTLLHELTHWTGHKSRLDRPMSGDKKAYGFEELVAELGAAFLCLKLGITAQPRADHAQYIGGWLRIMKEDKRALFRAAAAAQRAVDHLDTYQAAQALAA